MAKMKSRDYIPQFAKQYGLSITSFMGGKHNHGSLHGVGRAFDFDHKGISNQRFKELQGIFAKLGGRLVDERVRPKGQRVWGGPHFHGEFPAWVDPDVLKQIAEATGQRIQLPEEPMAVAGQAAPIPEVQATQSLIDGRWFNPDGSEFSAPTPQTLNSNEGQQMPFFALPFAIGKLGAAGAIAGKAAGIGAKFGMAAKAGAAGAGFLPKLGQGLGMLQQLGGQGAQGPMVPMDASMVPVGMPQLQQRQRQAGQAQMMSGGPMPAMSPFMYQQGMIARAMGA